jgi:AcrR family transcriptional regulator
MPRTKAQFAEMRKATREKILDAGIELFSRKGFAATNVQDIADLAGISTGLMYRHYPSKDDLFGALVAQAAEGLREVAHLFQSEAPPLQLIEQLTGEILTDLAKDDEFAQFLTLMVQAFMMEEPMPEVQQLVTANMLLLEQTARLIEKGQCLGQFKPGSPQAMAVYYFATIQGLGIMKFTMKERFILPGPEIVNAFLVEEQPDDVQHHNVA